MKHIGNNMVSDGDMYVFYYSGDLLLSLERYDRSGDMRLCHRVFVNDSIPYEYEVDRKMTKRGHALITWLEREL